MFKAYSGVILPQLFGFLSILFLGIGLMLTGTNIMMTQKSYSFLKDISVGLAASVFLGLGSFFLLQWCGIYV
ncbi:uncharacterized protein [Blastocystis hominis]|uniref:Dolichyl-diphosphooligosaccharide-protein glycosyltransferase subunit OST5 n=1 Tax=Blastocystis hominis TaxID=12968 RepID=D8M6A9_BLAHO|nr:uncharacterized protein [Blastocystis hominis]CBK23662.2 unnamed protein product [Blastocystis hominis]|eukprot:XP_012897710.1 uncharacterized protein [Blastocystis hominis]